MALARCGSAVGFGLAMAYGLEKRRGRAAIFEADVYLNYLPPIHFTLVRPDLTKGVVMQSSLEHSLRYFKVSPIKAFREIGHVDRYHFISCSR
jgi:hypothetical protein